MKNGHLPDHWQIWLWIGLAALILSAVARQYAIDIRGMSGFNANLIFLGVFVVFALLYLAFQEFISRTLGTALVKCLEKLFKWLGFKQREPEKIEPVSIPEEITDAPPAPVTIQQPQSPITPETAPHAEDGDMVYIGMDGGGINRLDKRNGVITALSRRHGSTP